jgi:hypothetical protein
MSETRAIRSAGGWDPVAGDVPGPLLVLVSDGTIVGLAERKGRLAKGFDADLVAFDGHPLFDITALLRPVEVIRAGEPLRPQQAQQ